MLNQQCNLTIDIGDRQTKFFFEDLSVEPMHQDTGVDRRAVISATGIRNILWRLVITWSGRPILTAGVVEKCDVGEESA